MRAWCRCRERSGLSAAIGVARAHRGGDPAGLSRPRPHPQSANCQRRDTRLTPSNTEPGPLQQGLSCSRAASRAPSHPRERTKRRRMGRSHIRSCSVKCDCEREEREKVWHFHCATCVRSAWLCWCCRKHISCPTSGEGWAHSPYGAAPQEERCSLHRRMKNCSEQLAEYSYSSFSSDMCQMV